MFTTKYALTIDDNDWEELGSEANDRSMLITTIQINGCDLHLEAHEVEPELDDDGCQNAKGEDSEFHALNLAYDINGPQQTITIRGRSYVLFAHAFGE